ncbi:hypothetical protein SKAU_G00079630 [Synaphobranchus kaupii]|uniref:G-protein coupled receptors family 1 profile domain-containing protein n=1 Tax=Synaphobranchus kaupii TaxID=118154 RepID=A0A9Q1J366_SYNKA|nr:hypothetical protein SKAU_G00079630 [Synaphobranchus kaupii]
MVEFLNHNSPFTISEGVYYILVASLGIPSNLLSIVVLCSQRCGVSRSTEIYLVSLAVVDTLFMVLGGLVDVGASWNESATSCAPSAFLCSFVSFNEQWTLCSCQWIITAFTLERYLVSRGRGPRPGHLGRLTRPQVALLLVLVSVIGSQVLSIPCCWLYLARPAMDGAEEWTRASQLWGNVSRVPLSSRCRALHSLHAPRPALRARTLVAPRGSAPFRDAGWRMRRSGRIQVVVSLVMVFLNLPHYVTQGIMAALHEQAWLERDMDVAVGVALMLQWLSMVIHFLLYCFLSSGFRRETLALLRRLCRGGAVSRGSWNNCCPQHPQAPRPRQVWLVQ